MTRLAWSAPRGALMVLLACVAAACTTGEGGTEPAAHADAGCTPGTDGCECLSGACPGGANLVCDQGQCRATCNLGELDCACRVDGCDATDAGPLLCVMGVCERSPDCPPGTEGCGCDQGNCADGLQCLTQDGNQRCLSPDCPAGTVDCPCTTGGMCSGSARCNPETSRCEEGASCTPGNAGCSCDHRGVCVGNLLCASGTCTPPDCTPGQEGCGCVSGICGISSSGEGLVCVAGICEAPSCRPGDRGCVCRGGVQCDGEGDVCQEGHCMSAQCVAGAEGCPCLSGGCATGLTCQAGVLCVDNRGHEGGPCRDNGTCDRNNRCDRTVTPAVCVFCDLGSQACQCRDDQTCNSGLTCQGMLCVGDADILQRQPPADPQCYTPCERDLVTPEGTRRCASDGLMPGCLAGQTCVQGSCTGAGESPRTCTADGECADFQICAQGHCYAECTNDSSCPPGMGCHRRVCRLPCSLDQSSCPAGTRCESPDGQNGFCMPAGTSAEPAPELPEGAFRVTQDLLEFSNTRLQRQFMLQNLGDEPITFTLRKTEHSVLSADGSTEVRRLGAGADCTGSDCPLWWVRTGEAGSLTQAPELRITASPRCGEACPTVLVQLQPGGLESTRWRGVIQVESPQGSAQVQLSYVRTPEGRWAGQMYYFADFESQGIESTPGTLGWMDRPDRSDVSGIRNGLIQRWGALRNGGLSGGWEEFKAVLTATTTGQWRFSSVQQECAVQNGACYLFDSGAGTLPKVYVTALEDSPIPTGITTLPVEMNLHVRDPLGGRDELHGRVVSRSTLHLAGDPAVHLQFDGDPSDVRQCDPRVRSNCMVFVRDMELRATVGARYQPPAATAQCSSNDFQLVTEPWLVPGFLAGTSTDPLTGQYQRGRCMDTRVPFLPAATDANRVANINLASANPIPDGLVRERTVELLDGAVVDQGEIFLFVRERYPSFLGDGSEITAYGYMLLTRVPAEIDLEDADEDGVPDAYDGNAPPAGLPAGNVAPAAQCSASVLNPVLGYGVALSEDNAPAVIAALLHGGEPDRLQALVPSGPEVVHYLCVDTGRFDGGPGHTAAWGQGAVGPNDDSCATRRNGVCEDGMAGSTSSTCGAGEDASDCGYRYSTTPEACPVGSEVVFFTTDRSRLLLTGQECQVNGTCAATLRSWVRSGTAFLRQVSPLWRCADSNRVLCDENRLDLRDERIFFPTSTPGAVDAPLTAAIDEAFRYRTQFASQTGGALGFAPAICEPISDATPYCYDPARIEQIRQKVDCLLRVYQDYYASAEAASLPRAEELYAWLDESFSFATIPTALGGLPRRVDGFERRYAELLITLADDAYTSAFESRFDLAGGRAAWFQGSAFEAGGLDLSGVTGFEMYRLYQAVQYYDLILNRFYSLGPAMAAALASGAPATARNFISAAMVTSYFDRVVRASTQRARSVAEIARRYQGFNRADLARRVVERAYTSSYLESVALADLIQRIYRIAGGTDRPQIQAQLEAAQLRYRAALLDLTQVYQSITDNVNFFGFPADYIPFPALDAGGATERNAFETVVQVALSKLDIARQREQVALTSARTFQTDAAQFQSELTRITRTYEGQLAELCGTFEAQGTVYPAIQRHAQQDPQLRAVGDPCGLVGNGAIHQAMGRIDILRVGNLRLATQIQNVLDEVEIERQRISNYCAQIVTIADYNYSVAGELNSLEVDQARAQQRIERIQRITQAVTDVAQTAICDSVATCVLAGVVAVAKVGAYTAQELMLVNAEQESVTRQEERNAIEQDSGHWNALSQCDLAQIDADARMQGMVLQLRELDVNGLELEYQMRLAVSELQRLRQEARRLQLEQEESLQMAVNAEAARNDPNVRIYRNDAVINADIAFQDALREVYRLTLVYEYYTSQSYARRGDLFLVRLVSAGERNLENYLIELQNAFQEFEEEYGNPDLRVAVVSLRDDVLRIPRIDASGRTLSVEERAQQLRERLRNPRILDRNGYLSLPFRTRVEDLSPLTRNHKVHHVEASIEGNDNGDYLGRLYLRQNGTSMVHTILNDLAYYRFPTRTAVINPFFNGTREFAATPEVYRNYRLRDRPLVNTGWELVINQRDEAVNRDINLNALTDIKLYLFYTDFTAF